MIIPFITIHLRALWQHLFDPLPPMWREVRRLRSEIERAKKAKRQYSHLDRDLRKLVNQILAIENGSPHVGWWK